MNYIGFYVLMICSIFSFGQEKIEPVLDKVAHPIGGKNDLDYIIKTQMIYPKNLLREKQDVIIHFNIIKNGSVNNINLNTVLKKKPFAY